MEPRTSRGSPALATFSFTFVISHCLLSGHIAAREGHADGLGCGLDDGAPPGQGSSASDGLNVYM